MIRAHRLLPMLLCGALACGDGNACSNDYTYPRADSAAETTKSALQLKLTDSGLDKLIGTIPDSMAQKCRYNPRDGSAPCALDNDLNPTEIRYYVGGASSSLTADSYFSLNLESMKRNLHMRVAPKDAPIAGDRGGIEIVFGCLREDLSACTLSEYVSGSVDMMAYPSGGACTITDKAGPGVRIKSLPFVIRPRIERDVAGDAVLVLNQDDISVGTAQFALSTQVNMVPDDPACGSFCPISCGLTAVFTALLKSALESPAVTERLANGVVDPLVSNVKDVALSKAAAIDLKRLDKATLPFAQLVGTLVEASTDSPYASGQSGAYAWNVDFDMGFIAENSVCVPASGTGDLTRFDSTPPQNLGAQVQLPASDGPGPATFVPFDTALLIAEGGIQRAMEAIFQSGGLCLDLRAEGMAQGSFSPTVGTFALISPAFAELAPENAPVDLRIVPHAPPTVVFGSGEGPPEERNSHVQLTWPQIEIEFILSVDDTRLRALSFTTDLNIDLTAEPADNAVELTLDAFYIENTTEVYNEMSSPLKGSDLEALLEVALMPVLNQGATTIDLSTASMGMAYTVGLIRASRVDGYLVLYSVFCDAADRADNSNSACYAGASMSGVGSLVRSVGLRAETLGDVDYESGALSFKLQGLPQGVLQLGYRVDGMGPWRSFEAMAAKGGELESTLHSARLRVPGEHVVEVRARRTRFRAERLGPVDMFVEVPDIRDIESSLGTVPQQEGVLSAFLGSARDIEQSKGTDVSGTGRAGCRMVPSDSAAWLGLLLLTFFRGRRFNGG